jgi:NADH dehydrogenase/NADH:ubiquinone oxidoreductase subunit G
MAKQPENKSFMDIFNTFGREMKVPTMDIEAVLEHHRKNLEALQKSASAASSGASSIMTKQRDALQEQLHEFAEMVKGYQGGAMPARSRRSRRSPAPSRSMSCATASANRWRRFAKATTRRETADLCFRSIGGRRMAATTRSCTLFAAPALPSCTRWLRGDA